MMPSDFERRETANGITLKLYRGEGTALLSFDLDQSRATEDFVGFAVEFREPGENNWKRMGNRLHFDYDGPRAGKASFPSTEAPIQKYRWNHYPFDLRPGEYRYRITAMYMRPDGLLVRGDKVESAISLSPVTIDGFVNVGFTRGFASSQAYARKFKNQRLILPRSNQSEIDFDTRRWQKHYEWLGAEARRLLFSLLDEAVADPAVTVDALLYEAREPDIIARLERLGRRLRAIIDNHGKHGQANSNESKAARRLTQAGGAVHREKFSRQQHNKVLIIKRNGTPERVATGSTNFTLRGLYIQANNTLVFDDRAIAGLYADVFDAYWSAPATFRQNPLSQQWHVGRNRPESRFSFCFSPHADIALSLDPIADAVDGAESSVLYAVVFLNQLTGSVRDSLDSLVQRSLFSYGVAQRTGGLTVVKPDGSRGLLPFAYLGKKAPQPFRSEWAGGSGQMVHHKFVVADFNGTHPKVFTGSSNLAGPGERDNGDNLLLIEDRKVAIAYAIEALRMFDHFHFRVALKEGDERREKITLQKPPAAGKKPWFFRYYQPGHVKERDRMLFAGE